MNTTCTPVIKSPLAISSVRMIRPNELTAEELAAWLQLIDTSPRWQSPFFHPHYIQTIGSFRRNIEIAVLTENGDVVGFFPFERGAFNAGQPVGGKLTDFQGMIGRLPTTMSADSLLKQCGLASWSFDHLPANQTEFSQGAILASGSPYLDLSNGWAAYKEERKQAHSRVIQDIARKERKLEREVGPILFVNNSSDDTVFETLLAWKSEQRKQTNTFDVLQLGWVVNALNSMRHTNDASFHGQLSALYAGKHIVAVHFGLSSRRICHFWFPAYNKVFASYSPGAILFLAMAREASCRGVIRLDLGKGEEQFKSRLGSRQTSVLEGGIDTTYSMRCVRQVHNLVHFGIQRLPYQSVIGSTKRLWNAWRHR